MSAVNWTDELREHCEDCDRRTPHEVSVEMRTESEHNENSAFSREPYRVSTCQNCNRETTRRMNNA